MGAVQIGTGNIGDKSRIYLSFMMSGLTGVGTMPGKGYLRQSSYGVGGAYMSSQIEGQDSTASVVGSMAGTGLAIILVPQSLISLNRNT